MGFIVYLYVVNLERIIGGSNPNMDIYKVKYLDNDKSLKRVVSLSIN